MNLPSEYTIRSVTSFYRFPFHVVLVVKLFHLTCHSHRQELNTRLKLATLSDIDPNNTKALLGGTKKEWKLPAKRSVEIGNMDDASQGEYNERA